MTNILNLPIDDYEEMIDFMRQDIDSDFALSKMVEKVKEKFVEEGRSFDAEFQSWRKEKHSICSDCYPNELCPDCHR